MTVFHRAKVSLNAVLAKSNGAIVNVTKVFSEWVKMGVISDCVLDSHSKRQQDGKSRKSSLLF